MRILTLNAGSSSHIAKLFAVAEPVPLEPVVPIWETEVESRSVTFDDLLAQAPRDAPDAVAHRVVHGGLDPKLGLDERIDDSTLSAIRRAAEFAPQHNGLALEGIAASARRFPGVPQFAIFDRALDAGAPDIRSTLPLPRRLCEQWQLRRLGFHGISHRDVILRVQQMLGRDDARVITVHLGSGCSLAAFRGARMLDTTMGMTPMEGLMMATRSGSIDPGIIFFLLRHGHAAADLEATLNGESGLLGVSGSASDTRDVIRAMDAGDPHARLAFDLYAYRIRLHLGTMAAVLGGIDAVSWSGPVGEHMPRIRSAAMDGLDFLGLGLDAQRNESAAGDTDISAPGATVRTFVIRTLEEWAMVRRTAPLLAPTVHA